jgi:hypothetical protein
MAQKKLNKEVEGYIRRIGQLRSEGRFGRAVQFCDRALEIADDPLIRSVIMEFKGDSLYAVGRKVKDETIIADARRCFESVLAEQPDNVLARQGLERIDRYF